MDSYKFQLNRGLLDRGQNRYGGEQFNGVAVDEKEDIPEGAPIAWEKKENSSEYERAIDELSDKVERKKIKRDSDEFHAEVHKLAVRFGKRSIEVGKEVGTRVAVFNK